MVQFDLGHRWAQGGVGWETGHLLDAAWDFESMAATQEVQAVTTPTMYQSIPVVPDHRAQKASLMQWPKNLYLSVNWNIELRSVQQVWMIPDRRHQGNTDVQWELLSDLCSAMQSHPSRSTLRTLVRPHKEFLLECLSMGPNLNFEIIS